MATETTAKGLTIFLKNGDTLRFLEVTIENQSSDEILFSYTSKGDGRRKQAEFFISNIAGYSLDVDNG
jgi:hypothetical protein